MQKPEIKTGVLKFVVVVFVITMLFSFTSSSDFWFKAYKELGKEKNDYEAKYYELLKEKNRDEVARKELASLSFKIFYYENQNPVMYHILTVAYEKGLQYKIDPYLILSVIKVESNFNPMAKSSAGAMGLMQVMPSVWGEELKIDMDRIFEIDYNISLGVQILKHYIDMYHGDIGKSLFAYNNGISGLNNNVNYVPAVLGEYDAKANMSHHPDR